MAFEVFIEKARDYRMRTYKPRVADKLLRQKLEGKGAVLVEGAKWCGKTTTSEQLSKSVVYMSDPEKGQEYLDMASLYPRRLLEGKTPRLIDEWQLAPQLWDAVRFEVDHRDDALGQFILTGSTVPPRMNEIHHTGTGRIARLKMRPMTLHEAGDTVGSVSLGSLFKDGYEINGSNSIDLERMAFLVCRGGWPLSVGMRESTGLEQAFDYCESIVNSDISRVDNVTRNPERVKRLMKSYARLQGTQSPVTVIREDMLANDSSRIGEDTVHGYILALKQIFVIEDIVAWNPNLRSKSAIRASDTRYFTDPSIATASLGLGPDDLMYDLNTFGLLFETLCMRDLRVYAEANGGQVYHYRDSSGLECDAVIHLRNGSYGLVEIKLGGSRLIEEGMATLRKLASKLDTSRMKAPSFKMVLTATGDYAYKGKDDILIVPIGCLKD